MVQIHKRIRENLFIGFLFILPLIFNPFSGEVEKWKFYTLIIVSLSSVLSAAPLYVKNKLLQSSLLILLVWGGLATVLSKNIDLAFWGSWDRHLGFAAYFLGILLALGLPFSKEHRFSKAMILSGGMSAAAAILLASSISGSLFEGRMGGTMGNPNILGQFLAITIFFNLYELHKKFNWPLILSLFLQCYVLIETGNRASWIALFCGLLGYYFFNLKSLKNVVGLSVVALITVFANWSRVLSVDSLETRKELYGAAIKSIQDHPLFGVGFEHIQDALILPNFTLLPDRIHQMFLDAALSGGIPFAFALLGLSLATLFILLQKKLFLGFAFLILLISLQVSFFTVIHLALYFIFVGMAIQLSNRSKNQKHKNAKY